MSVIEIFQDLYLKGPVDRIEELRGALVAQVSAPWSFDAERSKEIEEDGMADGIVLAFLCQPGPDHPAAGLTLWQNADGFSVPNIVPLETGSLSFRQYNHLLADFAARVAAEPARICGFTLEVTKAEQGIDDWLPAEAATKLRRFSGAANKSTGASHPMDARRWFDFMIAVHRGGEGDFDSNRLARWLEEIERWDTDTAHQLAASYENGLALLKHYDQA